MPFPYPSVNAVETWKLQAKAMVENAVLPSAHHVKALQAGAYTATNLLALQRFRDRIGWRMAFLEDSLLSTFLLTRTMRGQRQQLQAEAIAEAKKKVQVEVQTVEREQLPR